MSRPGTRWWWGVMAVLLLAGCASAPTQERSTAERQLAVLQESVAAYEAVRVAVQEAYIAGLIDDEQRDAIGVYGRSTESALRAATKAVADGRDATTYLAALSAAVAQLTAEWNEVRP